MIEPTLFDSSIPVIAVNKTVDPAETPRLSKQCATMLERLRQGPATNHELARIGLKYTSRISDLRAAGYDIQIVGKNTETGERTYALR